MAKKPKVQTGLTPEQKAAVDHDRGPIRVVATAGSGKTTVIVERTARLIESGVHPNRILLLAFSKDAKSEMEKRLNARLPGRDTKSVCKTFHSLSFEIFRAEVSKDEPWEVDSSGHLTRKAIRAGLRVSGILDSKPNAEVVYEALSLAKSMMLIASPALRRLGKDDGEERDKLLRLCRRYIEDLVDFGGFEREEDLADALYKIDDIRRGVPVRGVPPMSKFVGYDDMLLHAAEVLGQSVPAARWRSRWDYVMQDEAQDQNEVQSVIAQSLCVGHRNYMVVGDPAQSVYGFRGGDPEKLIDFEKTWPGSKTVFIQQNHRSGVGVVELSNKILKDGIGFPGFVPVSARGTKAPIAFNVFQREEEEATSIAESIVAHHRDGVAWKDHAIVVRTNDQFSHIEEAMVENGVPYRLRGTDGFFSSEQATPLFGAIRLIGGSGTDSDLESLLLSWKLDEESVKKSVEAFAKNTTGNWIDSVHLDSEDSIGSLAKLRASKLLSICTGFNKDTATLDVLDRLVETDKRKKKLWYRLLSFGDTHKSVGEADQVLRNIYSNRSNRSPDKVTVTNVHKSKGSEWKVVYVAGCSYPTFPASGADAVEEKRLFYVAVTRAVDELWISSIRHPSFPEKYDLNLKSHPWEPIGRRVNSSGKLGEQLSLL